MSTLHILVHFDDGGQVAATVAIIGGGEDCGDMAVVGVLVAVVH